MPIEYITNPTSTVGRKRLSYDVINGVHLTQYENVTTVRTGATYKSTLLFESENYEVARTFAVLYDDLIGREFITKDKKTHAAFFSKVYTTSMFGSERYDVFRGQLVRFLKPLCNEPLGFIKIK